MQIGAQLYTVRDFCKTTEDFSETLKKISEIGYRTVQVSGTCDYDALWLKEELKKNDLKCVITHIPVPKLTGDIKKVIDDHNIFNCNCIGLGYYSFDAEKGDTYEKFMDTFMPIAKEIKEAGKYFMYHNHDTEFRKLDDKIVLEHLLTDVDKDLMGLTLDTFWVQAGGGDPAEWIKKFSGRVPCIHLKDFSYGRKMAVIGEGNINFDRVFKEAENAGTKYMLVEQDDCNGEDPFDCLKRSYDFLKSRGFN